MVNTGPQVLVKLHTYLSRSTIGVYFNKSWNQFSFMFCLDSHKVTLCIDSFEGIIYWLTVLSHSFFTERTKKLEREASTLRRLFLRNKQRMMLFLSPSTCVSPLSYVIVIAYVVTFVLAFVIMLRWVIENQMGHRENTCSQGIGRVKRSVHPALLVSRSHPQIRWCSVLKVAFCHCDPCFAT